VNKLAIIHFAPIEFYPPIQNLLNELERSCKEPVILITSSPTKGNLSIFKLTSRKIRFFRFGISGAKLKSYIRYWNYLLFYSACLVKLIRFKPKCVVYFETISSLPAYLYKRFFNANCQVLIHYHEYTTPLEYQDGMLLTRYFHQFEKWLYPRACWVSHTNELRMEQFKRDIFPVYIKNVQIMPNYPPKRWKVNPKQSLSRPLKVVYVGALSLTTMYTKAFANWVVSQQGMVEWDIYSYNLTTDAKEFFVKLNNPHIKLRPGVDYDKIPAILKDYDIGIVIYNGHIANYIYNAPNKLFEYLACGLDVWFPHIMIGSLEFVSKKNFPKILSIDFGNLENFDLVNAIKRDGDMIEYSFYCEDALRPMINKLTTND
jgi:hypothetical protein